MEGGGNVDFGCYLNQKDFRVNSAKNSIERGNKKLGNTFIDGKKSSLSETKNRLVPVTALSDGRLGIALDDLAELLNKIIANAQKKKPCCDKVTQTILLDEGDRVSRMKKVGNLFEEMIRGNNNKLKKNSNLNNTMR